MFLESSQARDIGSLLEDDERVLAVHVAEFARRTISTRTPPESDAAARVEARSLLGIFGDSGWLRHVSPREYGGHHHMPHVTELCLIREALGYASPLADVVFAMQALGSVPITLSGNREMQERWLPAVTSGKAMAAFAMTEPEAGSDFAALATTARRDGGDYVLDGWKWLISNAGVADFYCVFASTDRSAGYRGISCFVVPADAAGLRFLGPQVLSEPHPLGELSLEGCRVPASHRLGPEGSGFKLALRALDRMRPTVAAAACGIAARALEESLSYSRIRHQFGAPLADLALIQQKLARMATDLAASRLLTYRAARAADDSHHRITLESSQAKLFATEAAHRIVDDAVQIHGGRGVLAGSVVDRLYRAVRALRIYEGTSEVQHMVIAREILREGF